MQYKSLDLTVQDIIKTKYPNINELLDRLELYKCYHDKEIYIWDTNFLLDSSSKLKHLMEAHKKKSYAHHTRGCITGVRWLEKK